MIVNTLIAKENPELWLSENKSLIQKIVNIFHFDTPKFSRDDLVQEANSIAIYAIGKYNVDSNATLSTYIYTAVKRACRDFIRKNKHDLYVSFSLQNKMWKDSQETKNETNNFGQNLFGTTESPMAIRSDVEKNSVTFGETIPSGELSVLDSIIKKEQVSILMEEISFLPEREANIICARFWDGKTLEEIATTQGCSRQRIDIISRRAMDKLTIKVKKRLEDELLI